MTHSQICMLTVSNKCILFKPIINLLFFNLLLFYLLHYVTYDD